MTGKGGGTAVGAAVQWEVMDPLAGGVAGREAQSARDVLEASSGATPVSTSPRAFKWCAGAWCS